MSCSRGCGSTSTPHPSRAGTWCFATLKAGTTRGAVGRTFVTGVSPLLVDDLSSGFNIATNISQDPDLNTLAGFTRADVERAVDALLASHADLGKIPPLSDRGALLDVLEKYYDGYRFSEDAAERVFNSDMVLYFLSRVTRRRRDRRAGAHDPPAPPVARPTAGDFPAPGPAGRARVPAVTRPSSAEAEPTPTPASEERRASRPPSGARGGAPSELAERFAHCQSMDELPDELLLKAIEFKELRERFAITMDA